MNRKWSERSLGNLSGIHPDLRRVIDRALQTSPLDFIVIEGLRTAARQKQLVASGASKTLNSRHITGHAVDLMPIGPDGKAAFDWPLYHKLGPAVKQAAKDLGVAIVWGGDWRTFKDGPHFELDRKVYPAGEAFPTHETVVIATQPARQPQATIGKPVLDASPEPRLSFWGEVAKLIAAIFKRNS